VHFSQFIVLKNSIWLDQFFGKFQNFSKFPKFKKFLKIAQTGVVFASIKICVKFSEKIYELARLKILSSSLKIRSTFFILGRTLGESTRFCNCGALSASSIFESQSKINCRIALNLASQVTTLPTSQT